MKVNSVQEKSTMLLNEKREIQVMKTGKKPEAGFQKLLDEKLKKMTS